MKQQNPIISWDLLISFLVSSFVFLSICSIHMISEHLGVTKEVMLSIIYASYFSHILLYFLDLPPIQMLLSISVQIILHRLLRSYPLIDTNSFSFYYSCIAFVINQILIFLFIVFSKIGATESIMYFLISSLAPLTIFYYTISASSSIKSL